MAGLDTIVDGGKAKEVVAVGSTLSNKNFISFIPSNVSKTQRRIKRSAYGTGGNADIPLPSLN